MKIWIILPIIILLNSCAFTSLLNSGTLNLKYRSVRASFNDELYEISDRVTNPSFSVRNVQHPKSWGRWNLNVRLTPSIHYDDVTYESGGTYFNTTTNQIERLNNINVRRLITLGNLKATFHTPIGAFSVAGGFGGTVYRLNDGAGLSTYKTREIRRLDFVWYGFLSKRLFVLMGPRYYKTDYETYEFAFRIGYFWGGIKR